MSAAALCSRLLSVWTPANTFPECCCFFSSFCSQSSEAQNCVSAVTDSDGSSLNVAFCWWLTITRGHSPPLTDLFHHIRAPVLEHDSQPESPASAAQSYGALFPPVLGLLRVWGRCVTQTVWGDDICPVRREGGREKRGEWEAGPDSRKIVSAKRADSWAESELNNYSIPESPPPQTFTVLGSSSGSSRCFSARKICTEKPVNPIYSQRNLFDLWTSKRCLWENRSILNNKNNLFPGF